MVRVREKGDMGMAVHTGQSTAGAWPSQGQNSRQLVHAGHSMEAAAAARKEKPVGCRRRPVVLQLGKAGRKGPVVLRMEPGKRKVVEHEHQTAAECVVDRSTQVGLLEELHRTDAARKSMAEQTFAVAPQSR